MAEKKQALDIPLINGSNTMECSWKARIITFPGSIKFHTKSPLIEKIKWFFYWLTTGWWEVQKFRWNELRRK